MIYPAKYGDREWNYLQTPFNLNAIQYYTTGCIPKPECTFQHWLCPQRCAGYLWFWQKHNPITAQSCLLDIALVTIWTVLFLDFQKLFEMWTCQTKGHFCQSISKDCWWFMAWALHGWLNLHLEMHWQTVFTDNGFQSVPRPM